MATQQPLLMRDDGSSGGSPVCVVIPGYSGISTWNVDNSTSQLGTFTTTPAPHQIRIQIAAAPPVPFSAGAHLPVISSGKCYVEFSLIGYGFSASGNYQIGVVSAALVTTADVALTANPSFFLSTTNQGSGGTTLAGYYVNGGAFVNNSAYSFGYGDIVGLAIDHGTGNVWVRKNGGAWIVGDPVAGTTPTATLNAGAVYIAIKPVIASTVSGDFNVAVAIQGDTFTYAAPAGYAPYAPLITGSGVTLLQHFDGSFADTSPLAATITVSGTPTISNANSVFGGTSYLGATNSYLTTPTNNQYVIRNVDFTFTLYFWRSAVPTGSEYLFEIYGSPSGVHLNAFFNGGPDLNIYFFGSSFAIIPGFLTGSLSTWINLTIVRRQGTLYVYKNGTLLVAQPAYWFAQNTAYITIGSSSGGNGYCFLGYIDELAYTKNYAAVSPITALAAPSSINDANWANNVLMLHFDGTDGATTFTDSSPNASVIATTAGPLTDGRYTRFGSGSLRCIGSGKLTATIGANGVMAGDFSIDFWLNITSANSVSTVQFYGARGGFGLEGNDLYYSGLSLIPFHVYGTPSGWVHIAIVRSSGTIYAYRNFVLQNSVYYAGVIDLSTLTIGAAPDNTANMTGYIDEFRVTAGVARTITQTFNPPLLPYCNSDTAPTGNTGKAKLVGTPLTITAGLLNNPNPYIKLVGNAAAASSGNLAGKNSNPTYALIGNVATTYAGSVHFPVFDATFYPLPNATPFISTITTSNKNLNYELIIAFNPDGTYSINDSKPSSAAGVWVTAGPSLSLAQVVSSYYIRVTVLGGAQYISFTQQPNLSTSNVFTITGFPATISQSAAVQLNITPISVGQLSPVLSYPSGQYSFIVNTNPV